eukprot:CAMPEP_0194480650 /NCGR_PEP_ID=MMETSP0253-20130528/3382_1 /TAXON_ID=2966 /ORGANISM="Noctiluca scintillans" /LENGTH=62 /DNA_ID=CAMNT_0039320061 /DNA_START=667 /DNA_END=855 /DNA_ORIENTATION=-
MRNIDKGTVPSMTRLDLSCLSLGRIAAKDGKQRLKAKSATKCMTMQTTVTPTTSSTNINETV